ncbi:MAG: amidase domain-containing protein [Ruminococcus sp.]|nr:amidase domain-containing protein [Ruminococcus sp.]
MKNKRFFSFITAVIMIFSLCTVLPAKVFVPFEASATGYNANVAIDYALKYWNNYNPNYSDYNSIGGDCANFVSQCLYTGGLEMTDKWFWYSYSNRSGSWASCPDMYNYFNEQGYKIIENPSDSQVLPGNIVLYYSSSKGRWSHAAICVGSNLNGPIVAAHNTNHCDANWKLGSNWSKRCTIIINDNPVPTPELVTPTISTDKSSYTVGDTVNISWTASPSGSNLSHYWLNVIAPDGTWIYGDTMNKNTSYSFTAQQSGNYTVTTYATPIGSLEGEGSLTDTKTIYVKSKNISYDLSLSETYIELEPNQSKDIVLTIRGGDFSGGEDIGKLNLDTSACDKIVDISNTTGGKASSYITMSFKVTALSSGSGSCRFYVTLDGKTIGSVNLNIVVKVNKCKVKLIDNFRHDTIDEYEAECGTAFSYSQLPDMGKEGYKFDGWYNGNQKYSVGSIVPEVSELRLYAQWTVNDNYYDVNSGRYGDINGDGKISAVDASRITMYINGTYELTDLEKIYADLDGSGVIDEYDVRIISLMYTHAPVNETFEELAAK